MRVDGIKEVIGKKVRVIQCWPKYAGNISVQYCSRKKVM